MSTHSVADAKNRLSELIQRALSGETVTITRHGAPVVQLKPVGAAQARAVTPADIAWLRSRRSTRKVSQLDSGEFIGRMRDEDDDRLS